MPVKEDLSSWQAMHNLVVLPATRSMRLVLVLLACGLWQTGALHGAMPIDPLTAGVEHRQRQSRAGGHTQRMAKGGHRMFRRQPRGIVALHAQLRRCGGRLGSRGPEQRTVSLVNIMAEPAFAGLSGGFTQRVFASAWVVKSCAPASVTACSWQLAAQLIGRLAQEFSRAGQMRVVAGVAGESRAVGMIGVGGNGQREIGWQLAEGDIIGVIEMRRILGRQLTG